MSLTLRAGDTVTAVRSATTISAGTLDTSSSTRRTWTRRRERSFAGTVSVTSATITGNADADTLIGPGEDAPGRRRRQRHARWRGGADKLIGGLGNDTLCGRQCRRRRHRGSRRRHRHGAERDHLCARRDAREPDADRRRQPQRHRQCAQQHVIGNRQSTGAATTRSTAAPAATRSSAAPATTPRRRQWPATRDRSGAGGGIDTVGARSPTRSAPMSRT